MEAGYSARFVEPLLDRYLCSVCKRPMRNPMQTECGHLFCRVCFDLLLQGSSPACPIENSPISRDTVFPDNACKREILNLEVLCNFEDRGCSWIGSLKALEDHTNGCAFGTVLCRFCGTSVPSKLRPVHENEECLLRPWVCEHCHVASIRFLDKEDHIQKECTEYLRPCPNCCDSSLKLKLAQLEAHLDPRNGDCPLADTFCPFKIYGCTFTCQKYLVTNHIDECRIHHIHLQAECWEQLKENTENTTRALESLINRLSATEARMLLLEDHQKALKQRMETTNDFNGGPEHWESVNYSLQDQVAQLSLVVKEVENKIDAISTSSIPLGNLSKIKTESGMHINSQQIDSIEAKTKDLDHGLDRCLSSCLDQELRLQLLERATYNGVLLWKINDFERRRKEAVDGVTMSLYSVPFYTSRHGYKMCARVYLNGDGMGKGSHLSFFFVVMKGPFDALLPWPFKQKVTLTIINQAGKKHITDAFRPDPQSSSFQRPTQKEMNVASGCPMFIRQEHLLNGGFVRDDCIFLRVVVDTSDVPLFVS